LLQRSTGESCLGKYSVCCDNQSTTQGALYGQSADFLKLTVDGTNCYHFIVYVEEMGAAILVPSYF